MHLVTYTTNGSVHVGVLTGASITQVTGVHSMLDLVQAGPGALEDLVPGVGRTIPMSPSRLLAPLPMPGKIVAVGLNYMDHARERGVEPPKQPLIFAKFTSSVTGPGAPIRWDPKLAEKVDYEVELGVVIGREARNVREADALDHVFGYTVLNDVTARDMQRGDGQWVRGKSLDTFCPMGPSIVTADEVRDPQTLSIRCSVNGETMQSSNTSEMIFGVAELIAYISRSFTLHPGDIIATGTPGGVGEFRDPPVFLKDRDVVTCEIERIGKLQNPCEACKGD
jgi:2-keto-4-pentenoate hydratase/2-oxohepta-3-ene-1,7-dioic acid hydratase in catechol pathway